MYPRIEVKVQSIIDNFKKIQSLCAQNGITLSVVTKVLSDKKEIVKAMVDNGVKRICESRIENLISYKNINAEKWLIRLPMFSEIADVVQYADVSLNSELETIIKLNDEANKQGKKHKIILMYELGDLREGCLKPELKNVLKEALKLNNIEVYGIGVNLSCYGEIVPTEANMKELEELVLELEKENNYKFKIVSGGNSSSYKMLADGKIPKTINNLRMGEAVFFGNVPCFEEKIEGLNQDVFTLKAQIIELKEKPSIPWGERGMCNSFGQDVSFADRGIRKRAIVAIGKQDVLVDGLKPIDEKVIILDGSSDHIILDVTDSNKDYKMGDIVEFRLNYAGVLSVMTSKYVEKVFIN